MASASTIQSEKPSRRRDPVVIGPARRGGLWMAVTTASLIGAAVVAVAAPRVLTDAERAAPTPELVAAAAPIAVGGLSAAAQNPYEPEPVETAELAPVAAPASFEAPAAEPARPVPTLLAGAVLDDTMTLAAPDAAAMSLWEYETGRADSASPAATAPETARPTPRQPLIAAVGQRPSAFASELRLAYLKTSLDAVERRHLDLAAALADRAERVRRGDIPPRPSPEAPIASSNLAWAAAAAALRQAEVAGAAADAPALAAEARATVDCWRIALVVAAGEQAAALCRERALRTLAMIATDGGGETIAALTAAANSAPTPLAEAQGGPEIETASTRAAPSAPAQPQRPAIRSRSPRLAPFAGGYSDGVVYFALDSAELTPAARTGLTSFARAVVGEDASLGAGGLRVAIYGHADTAGAESFNELLSRRRAEQVRDALSAVLPVDTGVMLEAHGERTLKVRTADGVIEPKNRRVEIVVAR